MFSTTDVKESIKSRLNWPLNSYVENMQAVQSMRETIYRIFSLECRRFPCTRCVRELSVLARDREGWLRNSGRGGPLSASLLLPRTPFRLSPSLFRVWIRDDARLIKMRSLAKIRLHCRLTPCFYVWLVRYWAEDSFTLCSIFASLRSALFAVEFKPLYQFQLKANLLFWPKLFT